MTKNVLDLDRHLIHEFLYSLNYTASKYADSHLGALETIVDTPNQINLACWKEKFDKFERPSVPKHKRKALLSSHVAWISFECQEYEMKIKELFLDYTS